MVAVEFHDITKKYGRTAILENVDLTIEDNAFTVILGAPASGKSVLLRLMTGLEKPNSGKINLRGADVTKVSPGERNIGYVPQSFALYPHFKVYDNIAYPLKLLGVRKSDIAPVVAQTAELLKISPLLDKKPEQLSGGEKQRVAIARGIVKNTEIFVMDDPLTGLDFKLREQLFDDLKRLQEALQATLIYTTSDPMEALMLADNIIVIHDGQAVESGPLVEVYDAPQHLATMLLLGFPPASLIEGSLGSIAGDTRCQSSLFDFPVTFKGTQSLPDKVAIAIRPQDVQINPSPGNGWLTQEAEITLREDLGGELVVYLEYNGQSITSVVRYDEAHLIENDQVTIGVQPDKLVLYDPETGQRLGQGAK
jgi:ABC-type sugar transport system ATPase subunit